ncbi:MAG TPA: hypothetical protein DIT93_10015 [Pelagibacterium sp.]|uniref:hypothetical protein n=1 Tax=uncultured Pelagibacterium sp. TaxID=1159875 RepID=UPI000C36D4A8|nr:hypothetical protein [Pelagibacterium sp.]HCO55341.1 hypothetical protein [Pelagibacterium sp.]|tara:strand:+ start:11981 stop:12211 length:231 start_codon:yes stop_codon:yes gene_type:complete
MPDIFFNPEAIGLTRDEVKTDVREPVGLGAFIPVMPSRSHVGVEAIIEGLRLAYIKGSILEDATMKELVAKHVDRR